jgi:hypothetical protein
MQRLHICVVQSRSGKTCFNLGSVPGMQQMFQFTLFSVKGKRERVVIRNDNSSAIPEVESPRPKRDLRHL